MASDLHPKPEFAVACSLVDSLIETADEIRQLYTDVGLRPYRVFMVWVDWSADVDQDGMINGEERYLENAVEGVGKARLIREVEILPTPLVEGLAGLSGSVDAVGNTERGNVTVTQISMSYTEDQLQGLLGGLRDPHFHDTLKQGVTFFYEIMENRPEGYRKLDTGGADVGPADLRSPRRRFQLNGPPSRSPEQFQWSVQLVRADGERGRNGEVDAVEGAFDE